MNALAYNIKQIMRPVRFTPFALALLPFMSQAAPVGGNVVSGSASITQSGNITQITQETDRAIINFSSFSVAENESVIFSQPSSSSITLNRVTGISPSSILGQIQSDSQVFIVNPNGVFFGPNSSVNVSALVATTLDISNDDFNGSNFSFAKNPEQAPDRQVINQGQISTDGFVVLAGDFTENTGIIQSTVGNIALAAGERISMNLFNNDLFNISVDAQTISNLAGVSNSGTLLGKKIFMTAKVSQSILSSIVNNSGTITATGISINNGEIFLTGEGGTVQNGGSLTTITPEASFSSQVQVSGDQVILTNNSVINSDFVEIISNQTTQVAGLIQTGNAQQPGNVSIQSQTVELIDDFSILGYSSIGINTNSIDGNHNLRIINADSSSEFGPSVIIFGNPDDDPIGNFNLQTIIGGVTALESIETNGMVLAKSILTTGNQTFHGQLLLDGTLSSQGGNITIDELLALGDITVTTGSGSGNITITGNINELPKAFLSDNSNEALTEADLGNPINITLNAGQGNISTGDIGNQFTGSFFEIINPRESNVNPDIADLNSLFSRAIGSLVTIGTNITLGSLNVTNFTGNNANQNIAEETQIFNLIELDSLGTSQPETSLEVEVEAQNEGSDDQSLEEQSLINLADASPQSLSCQP
jgi:filamentous hemagglutinin family protein